ncbi:MAG: tRNA (guanosine(37)-N1)-methyltransferase TrmD [Bifidobacteriaceae bacterium]|jgi:tRNA (guanine37-N1)-methyltransferase|nr:tRNA (guanosine(37)-N1)-methyltransferase TrmD [Bifidobacteriaceae bacterium]
MLIDVVTIFPDYLAPAGLSLLGRAQEAGLIQLRVHDLRDWTHDRHRTVDDTPYGGGAGMVMRPEPWGEALDAILASGALGATPAPNGGEAWTGGAASSPVVPGSDGGAAPSGEAGAVLVFPTPAGRLFDQATAERLSRARRLVFACGRYEGIDQRVVEHYRARGGVLVEELSIGDYVLAGGEVAALAMIEAATRLVPGVLGNAESLAEESHAEPGLLEYPVYTKPPAWRGLDVPPILLSGDHGRIARWRRDQAAARTARARPDLRIPGARPQPPTF